MLSRKILLIAFFYPPSRSSGVFRALALGNYLADQGHEVTVLTTTHSFFELESGPPDESLVARIDPRIKIIRVPFSVRPIHRNLDLMSRGTVRFEPILKWLMPRSFHSKLSLFALRSGGSFFPPQLSDRYRTWYGPSVEAVTESMDLTQLDAIIATGNPWTSFAIARTISQISSAPYVMDYRDPWKIDVRTGQPMLRSATTEQFELEMLEGAAFITHPNQYLADEYARFFPSVKDRVRVMENGYDPESLPEVDALRPIRTEESDELVYGTLGTVSDMWPLAEFGEAWRTYVADHPTHRFDLAGHLGWFDSGRAEIAAKIDDIGDGAAYVGPRARANVPDFYASLDVLVMFSWGGRGLTAGKMYEFGAIGLPILCIQPEGGGVRTFLERDHPRAVCVDPDPAQILEGLRRVEAFSRNMTAGERAQIRTKLSRNNRTSLLAPIDELTDPAEDR